MIPITPHVSFDETEVTVSFIRAAGPGGQHVNTTSSAVQLRFDARRSPSLPNDVAIRLMALVGSRLTQDGVIVLTAQSQRSQKQNRVEAMERLIGWIKEAATPPQKRRATKPTKASKERRLQSKEKRSSIKSTRQSRPMMD